MVAKSINCGSCGAGLRKVVSNRCKCDYCGNTNLILDNGHVKIIPPPDPVPKRITKDDKKPISLTMIIIFILLGGFFGLLLCRRMRSRNALS